ncbi:MAG: RimK family alpha-L-glutamate ligase [Planctomycetota bacterium]
MRLGVLASPDSWYLRDLRRAAGERHAIEVLEFPRIIAVAGMSGGGDSSNRGPAANGGEVVRGGGIISGERLAEYGSLSACSGKPLAVHSERAFPSAGDWSQFHAVLVRTMPPGSLEQVVFRMDALGRYEAAGGLVVNRPRAVEAAVDKYLTSALLAAAGLDTPKTIVCQHPDDAMEAFARLGGDVVVKPLFGSEGRGITRLSDPDLALRAFKMLAQLGAVLYLQEFVAHDGFDIRLLVVGNETFGMRRHNPLDWRTNVSRGATGIGFQPDEQLVQLARRAADAVGADVAGVDLLPAPDGRLLALEVNAVPGWKALSQATGVDIAERVLSFVESRWLDASKRLA